MNEHERLFTVYLPAAALCEHSYGTAVPCTVPSSVLGLSPFLRVMKRGSRAQQHVFSVFHHDRTYVQRYVKCMALHCRLDTGVGHQTKKVRLQGEVGVPS